MRRIRKIIYIAAIVFLIAVFSIALYLASLKPQYSGTVQLVGLKSQAEVLFDSYGIPHIYAKNEEDAYTALGYVHAQERLFQMEMIRRIAKGTLSEIFGREFVPTDKFFKTLCLEEHAIESAGIYLNDTTQAYQRAAIAYLKGVNRFIEYGRTPVEFSMLGIKKQKFSKNDLFLPLGYMAFNFAQGFKTDPTLSYIYLKYGENYLKDVMGSYQKGSLKIPVFVNDSSLFKMGSQREESTASMLEKLPVPPLVGSNGWVLSPKKSKSGKVLFANDTHIGFSQPCVWYEAHIEYPGFSFYGNYLAGFPFAAIGHSPSITWGLTMFMNDDVDFYTERIKPDDRFKVWEKNGWKPLKVINKKVHVKNEEDRECIVRISNHGPLVQGVMPEWKYITSNAVSLSWTHLKFPSNLLQVTYNLNHATNIDEARIAASQIISPGLNIMFGDSSGNIAWWAAAKLINRPENINSSILLSGISGYDDIKGYYDFSYNPKSENPPEGILISANNQPESLKGFSVPGYYLPEDRAQRITQLLTDREKYSVDDFKRINVDVISNASPKIAQSILSVLSSRIVNKSETHNKAYYKLLRWTGDHQHRDVEPTIYYRLIYYILEYAMKDELGETNFKTYLQTHAMKNSLASFIENDKSKWWDNINTKRPETRKIIFDMAFDQTVNDLVRDLDVNINRWEWGLVHQLEHVHPIGMKKPFNLLFNVGPFPVPGGIETINNAGFDLTDNIKFRVKYGPAMRIILDFSNYQNSISILPTGESGNLMSTNYKNQSSIYNNGKFRKQKMNRHEIEQNKSGRLVLQPAM